MLDYKQFILEFKETEKNTPVLYKDNNLEIKVVKTLDASREQGKDTAWCSNSKYGFYKHNITANMFRFNWKDGYKLRLTWDYINLDAASDKYAGGTHWGAGGKVNGQQQYYDVIRPRDENHPFDFDEVKDHRADMVRRIKSIPDDAKLACYQYQESHTQEKTALVNQIYSEIKKIKILNVEVEDTMVGRSYQPYSLELLVDVMYRNKQYTVEFKKSNRDSWFNFSGVKGLGDYIDRTDTGNIALNHYFYNELMRWLKQHNKKDISVRIKNNTKKEEEA